MTYRIILLSTLGVLLCVNTACLEGAAPENADVIYLSSLEQDTFEPTIIPDPGPPGDPKNNKQFQQLFDGVEKNAQALFDRPGVERQLDLIERAYISAGKYQDLMAMYTKHVEAKKAKSPVAGRLAWAMVKLGQDKRARELSASLIQQDPQNPTFWFIHGAYWLRFAGSSNEAAKKLIVSWEETLKLSPAFTGFDRVNAPAMKKEIAQQRQRINPTTSDLASVRQQLLKTKDAPKTPAPEPNTPATTTTPTPNGAPGNTPDATKPAPSTAPTTPENPVANTAPDAVKTPTPEPTTPTPKANTPTFKILLTRAVLANGNNNTADAISYLNAATKSFIPGDLAKTIQTSTSISQSSWILYLQLRWSLNINRNETARAFRALVSRKDIQAQTLLDATHFAHKQLEDKAMATKLATQLKSKAPELYKQMGLSKLTETQN